MLGHRDFHELAHALMENFRVKTLGMGAQFGGMEGHLLHFGQGTRRGRPRSARQRTAGFAFQHGLQRPARAVRDDRPPGRHRFQRRQAEIFFARKNQGAAAGVFVGDFLIGQASQEAHGRPGALLQHGQFGPVADDVQLRANPVAGVDHQIHALVADQAGDDEEMVADLVRATGA